MSRIAYCLFLLLCFAPELLAQSRSSFETSSSGDALVGAETDTDTEEKSRCSFGAHFSIRSNTKLYAAGAHAGRRLHRQMDDSGYAATQIDVALTYTDNPVVLLLGAFEPTIWTVGWSPRSEIVAVVLSGYYRQEIVGLPEEVPILRSTFASDGPCGYFVISPSQKARVEPIAQTLFKRNVDVFEFAEDGRVTLGRALPASTTLVTDTSQAPEEFLDMESPRVGALGLLDAMRSGTLRKATEKDFRHLRLALERRNREGTQIASLPESRTYVVRREFQYPAGLVGSNAVGFIIAEGVVPPQGTAGDSVIVDLNKLNCWAPNCAK